MDVVRGQAVKLHRPLHPLFKVRMDEDIDTGELVLEDIIGAPPHNDTGTLPRHLLNYPGLDEVDFIVQGHIVGVHHGARPH